MTDRAKLKKKLDTVHSKLIRSREKSCVVCGSTDMLQCGHLFSRVALSTRWDTAPDENCHTQCASCNFRHEMDSYPYNNWYIEKFGKEAWDKLHQRYNTTKKYTIKDLADKIEEFKKELEGADE